MKLAPSENKNRAASARFYPTNASEKRKKKKKEKEKKFNAKGSESR